METNKRTRYLLPGIVILLILNLVTLFLLFRKSNESAISDLERARVRMDSVSVRLSAAQQQIDSLLRNMERSSELVRQVDGQVGQLVKRYGDRYKLSLEKIVDLRHQMRKDQEGLKQLQQELKQL